MNETTEKDSQAKAIIWPKIMKHPRKILLEKRPQILLPQIFTRVILVKRMLRIKSPTAKEIDVAIAVPKFGVA